jgi:hypothetical protein
MKRASFCVAALTCLTVAALAPWREAAGQQGSNQAASSTTATPSLNYEYFKAKVQPVFLARRPGHARCVVCHAVNNAPFHLVSLSPGSATWDEAQSRQNFELVKRVVVPGYEGSRLLTHPLAEHAGGDPHHGGGQQFTSQDDPEWSTLKAFVSGATLK